MAEAAAVDTSKKADEGSLKEQIFKRLDEMRARMDSFEADAKADGKKKSDDGDLTLKHEGSDKEPVQGGDIPPVADKKKKADAKDDAKDDAAKDDEAKKPDSKKADAKKRADWPDEDEDKKDDSKEVKADEDEDEEKKDSKSKKDSKETKADGKEGDVKGDARADEVTQLKARLARLESRESMPDEDHAAFTETQSRADEVYGQFGKRASRPQIGESLLDYRRRLATGLLKHSPEWSDTKMSELPLSAFDRIEKKIYNDAMIAAQHPTDLAEGEERAVVKVDPLTGQRRIEFFSDHSFIKDLTRPSRKVAGFAKRNNAAAA